jgi:hypothetical protein
MDMGILMIFAGIVFLAYTFCASLLLIIGLIAESRGLRIAGVIELAPAVTVVLWFMHTAEKGEQRSKDPAWVFEQELGTPPPSGVTGLRGLATEINDTGDVYLSFSAPLEVIDALVPNLMDPTSPKTFRSSAAQLPAEIAPRSGGIPLRFHPRRCTWQGESDIFATRAATLESSITSLIRTSLTMAVCKIQNPV